MCHERAVGGQLSDVANAVSASMEERAGSGVGGADHAEDERFGDVAGAVQRGDYADDYRVVEYGTLYFCWWFDIVRSMSDEIQ